MVQPVDNTQAYKVLRADITSNRFVDGGVIDVANIIAEINIFEHLERCYLTANLVLVDDSALLDRINFMGTEKFTLELAGIDGVDSTLLRQFRITGVEKSTRVNDRTEVFALTLIDEHGYSSFANRFSKSYSGKVEDIIQQIITSEMGMLVNSSQAQPSVQAPIKGIIPYLNPIQAVNWLRDRATTANGSPYYVYASVHDEAIRISDFDTLLRQEPFNKALAFHYSAATINAGERAGYEGTLIHRTQDDGNKKLDLAFIVKSVNRSKTNNTLQMIKSGAVAASYSNTDIGGGLTIQTTHDIASTLNQLNASNVIKSFQQQNVYDSDTEISAGIRGNVPANTVPSRFFHEISSSKTYDNALSFNQEDREDGVRNKARMSSIIDMMARNQIEVEVPGEALMLKQVSVGDIVTINFLNSNFSELDKSTQELMDKNNSGDFLIISMRHIFKDTTHSVSMGVSKLTRGSAGNE